MKPEKTKRRTSLCLGILSLLTGGLSVVVGSMGLLGGQGNVFDVPLDYRVLLWFVLAVLGVLAVISGLISRFKVGVVLGAIGAVLCTFVCFLAFVIVGKGIALKAICYHDLQILTRAMQEYCEQNEGTLPDADAWCDQLVESAESEEYFSIGSFLGGRRGPSSNSEKRSCFAFNKNLGGYRLSEIDRPTVLLFETRDFGWNQNGTLASLPSTTHPGFYPFIERGAHFVLVLPDSTFLTIFCEKSELDSLNWTAQKEN
ncbi:MAG: hypothetical protein JXD22_12035 [Sedimentisphaerales bacterium]|nr:hypothetical protein [Sedimentisphaerales bacterium]